MQEKICKLNETTVITLSVPNMDGIDQHGIGVNYENNDSDKMKNGCNYIDNSNVNKSSLN